MRYFKTNMKHWKQGGTGITNFDEEERELYEAAVKEFGCPHLKITPYQLEGERLHGGGYSLHDHIKRKNLAVFWSVFRRVKLKLTLEK